jgi:hypothetical protein
MLPIKFRWPLLVTIAGVAALLALPTGSAAEKEPAKSASKLDLTPESFSKLHSLIRPQATEWRHLQVQWITDVIAARSQAAKQDKPLVVLYTGGAGYNEPLGIC